METKLINLPYTAKASPSNPKPGRQFSPTTFLLSTLLTATQFKENPDAWLLVDKILSDAQYPQTKCEYKVVGVNIVGPVLTLARPGIASPRQRYHDEVESTSSRSVSRYIQ